MLPRRPYVIAGLIIGSLAGLAFDQACEVFSQSPPDGKLEAAHQWETRAPRLLAVATAATIIGGCAGLLPRIVSAPLLGAFVGAILDYGAANVHALSSLPSPVVAHDWHEHMRRIVPVAMSIGAAAGLLFGTLSAAGAAPRRMHANAPCRLNHPDRTTPSA